MGKVMREIIQGISRGVQVDNVQDAKINKINLDGTYDLELRSGAIKRKAINLSSDVFSTGDVVNITMVSGSKETAKIVGRSSRSGTTAKIIRV